MDDKPLFESLRVGDLLTYLGHKEASYVVDLPPGATQTHGWVEGTIILDSGERYRGGMRTHRAPGLQQAVWVRTLTPGHGPDYGSGFWTMFKRTYTDSVASVLQGYGELVIGVDHGF